MRRDERRRGEKEEKKETVINSVSGRKDHF